ncbi:D-alanyl-D-alanine carboxypeptidase/D-alanyl-D-alanine-endopeptidase [Herminiimonas aquatilis]|uniref:D-alanyl-D-alanine carboxypeptidase/D-alanyl-D-alanine endopeptidase n=1 Tax=Herminiimonas aquatilis TaxID=345342 RepID=UPI0036D269CB
MRITRLLLPVVSLLVSIHVGISCAQAAGLPSTVADALKRSGIPQSAVATYVQDVSGPVPRIAINSTQGFNPASTMKLVTSNAALDILGPAFTWKTQVYATGTQNGDVLNGDLVIKGSGDPKLVTEKFWQFLRQIRAAGIREIHGNLILDRSVFEDMSYDASRFDGDPLKPYNAGPDALLLNYKVFAFHFLPDINRRVVNVSVDPPLGAYPIALPVFSDGPCTDWQARMLPVLERNSTQFAGAFPAACGEKTWYLHPYQMTSAEYFGLVFRDLWADVGGIFKGAIVDGLVPPNARFVTEWQSPALPEVIRDINKYSNNVMARQLLLTLASDVLKVPANPERGARVIKTWLTGKGIDASQLVIENGSGLSRSERISAESMGRMLVAAFQSPIMPELMSALPLAGYDGTMRKRLLTQTVAGRAHIKTGSLNDVRAVAGYVLAVSGKRYAVVCIINHINAPGGQAAHDALLQWIYENG